MKLADGKPLHLIGGHGPIWNCREAAFPLVSPAHWDELEGLRNRFGTPLTGRFFTYSKNQSQYLPTRFPK